jgi:hypothetical protein
MWGIGIWAQNRTKSNSVFDYTKPYQEFNLRHKFSLLLMGIMSRCSSAHKAAGLKYVYIDFVRFSKSCRVQFCAMSR